MTITKYTYQSYSLINAPKIHTDLLWDLAVLFVGLAVVYFVAIFLFRNVISNKSAKTKKLKKELSPMISEFIFFEEDATKEEKSHYVNLKIEIRELLKDDFNRKVVSEILLDLQKDVSGSAQKRLFELYRDFELHSVSYKKLKSWRWEKVSQGIQELTQMQVAESYSFITKFINDKRATIRKQAEIAVVTLKHEGLNYFLDTTKHKISEWQQLKLLEVIRNQTDYLPPSFKVWLTSKNKYVVLFALRLIKHYDQNDASTSIVELVKHKNNQIKQEAIDCIKTFHLVQAIATLKTVFWKCTVDIKIRILDTIGNLGSEADIEFLQLIEKKEASFAVRSKALSAINMISPERILPSEGILDTDNYKIPDDIKPKKMEEMKFERTMEDVVQDNFNALELADDAPVNEVPMAEVATEEREGPVQATAATASTVESVEAPTSDKDPHAEIPQELLEMEVVADSEGDIREEPKQQQAIEGEPMSKIPRETLEIEVVIDTETAETVANSKVEALEMDPIVETSQEILEIELKEEMDEIIEGSTPWDDGPEGEAPDFSLDFLPIVLDQKTEITVQEFQEPTGQQELHIAEIPVIFEELASSPEVTAKPGDSIEITEVELNFIPIVVENAELSEAAPVEEEPPVEKEAKDIMEYEVFVEEVRVEPVSTEMEAEVDLMDMEVDFEEVTQSKPVIPAKVEKETVDLSTLPVVSGEIIVPPSIQQENEVNIMALEVDFEEIEPTNLEILFAMTVDAETVAMEDEIADQELPHWIMDEISKPLAATGKTTEIKMEGPEWESKASKMKDEIEELLKIIPAPEYYENEVEERIQLLDDIEMFGDEREVPLLQELMEKEDQEASRLRILEIMMRFSGPLTETDNDLDVTTADTNKAPYSIFEEFFRPCDTESKLILLGEIASIGDEKEVYFLEQLLQDPEPEIRKKASKVLAHLKERLAGTKTELGQTAQTVLNEDIQNDVGTEYEQLLDEMEIHPPKESDIFDIGFELSENFGGNADATKKPDGESTKEPSFLSRFNLFSNKTKPKGNG